MGGRGKNRKKQYDRMPEWTDGKRYAGEQCIDLHVICSVCRRPLVWFERSTVPDDPNNGRLTYRGDHSDFAVIEQAEGEWTAMMVRCERGHRPHFRAVTTREVAEFIAEKWRPGHHDSLVMRV